jgi:DNA-binding response OmpR family regulator
MPEKGDRFASLMTRQPTVLIVDDEPGVTLTLARMLRLEGYEVLTALTADAGLRKVELVRPDAVLVDLRMPIVDGLAFLRLLRAHEVHRLTPVAIVTGDYFLGEAERVELRVLDASVYYKPLWIDDLLRITRRLIGKTH